MLCMDLPRIRRKKTARITVNLCATQYEIIEQIIKNNFGWKTDSKTDEDPDDSDVIWSDIAIPAEKLAKLKPYQKINHFPGMHELARKNYLAKNLNKMQKLYPNDYDFYPKTWLYPTEFPSLKFSNYKKKTYIVKPEASSQGKGIFLTRTLEGFEENERYVIQEYIQNPLLIDGLKFDMRVYVLLAGCDPLKVFVHKEGLSRFATQKYAAPTWQNLSNCMMHLTNYAINKTSEDFIFNSDPKVDNVGHKRSLTATLQKVKELGFDTEKIWTDIQKIIVKTLCTAQPSLAHVYRACQPDDPYNGICFEILGFDVILDDTGKAFLLEVNHSPSFNIDSPLDKKIKTMVISDAFVLLNITGDNKKEYEDRQKKKILLRSISHNKELEKENKKKDFFEAQERRNEWENSHCGGYELIFPNGEKEFEGFLRGGMKIWIESTGGKVPAKETRPQTQENHLKTVSHVKKNSPDLSKTPGNGVFQRLYQVKKPKFEQGPVPPHVLLDDAFRTQYFKSQTPYSFMELVVAKKIEEKVRPRSIPKQRIKNFHHHLDKILKEKRAIEGLKRTFNISEGPLQISPVVPEDSYTGELGKARILRQLVLKRII